jgi:hypothetical protein
MSVSTIAQQADDGSLDLAITNKRHEANGDETNWLPIMCTRVKQAAPWRNQRCAATILSTSGSALQKKLEVIRIYNETMRRLSYLRDAETTAVFANIKCSTAGYIATESFKLSNDARSMSDHQ